MFQDRSHGSHAKRLNIRQTIIANRALVDTHTPACALFLAHLCMFMAKRSCGKVILNLKQPKNKFVFLHPKPKPAPHGTTVACEPGRDVGRPPAAATRPGRDRQTGCDVSRMDVDICQRCELDTERWCLRFNSDGYWVANLCRWTFWLPVLETVEVDPVGSGHKFIALRPAPAPGGV